MTEYLVTCGQAGEIGRFRSDTPIDCARGDRVVVRTSQGVAIGTVRCEAAVEYARLIDGAVKGELLRRATAEDELIAEAIRIRTAQLFDDARQLVAELNLPLEIIDVDVQLDGHRVTVYHLRWADCDERILVSALSKKYEAMVAMRDAGLPEGATACGRPDCQNDGKGGGCATCTSGGCATGCGSKGMAREVQEYFAALRQKMEQNNRVPLL
jgi:cell fate regulator YaaT (PSP1 superfamily)